MAIQKIARRDSSYRVVSVVPDFCFVPGVAPPVPFPLFADLGNAKQTAKKVKINGKQAFVHNASAAPKTFGDQPGIRKGVVSRTVGKKAWSKLYSSSVHIHKHKIVRTGDLFFMNGKFNKKLHNKVCLSCKAALAVGRPVNPVLGIKFLSAETDFSFGGILPLNWQRSYFSDQEGITWLGHGWSLPFSHRLLQSDSGFLYVDDQGRTFPLPDLSDDEDNDPIFLESEQIWFAQDRYRHCFISNLDGSLSLRFAPLHRHSINEHKSDDDNGNGDDDNNDDIRTHTVHTEWALVAVEDANGNHQRVIYHHQTGLPEYVIDGNGRVFYLHFANVSETETQPLLRLSAVYLLDSLPEFNTDLSHVLNRQTPLVHYQYDKNGDLTTVSNQAKQSVRKFSYQNHILTSHTDAAGYTSHYEYDEYTPNGKVIRNWTNLNEQWHFEYQAGHTIVTDTLGRSEHYYFDDNNELIRHIHSDSSETQMERDHLGRLLSHTDELGRTTRYQYNAEGQIIAIVRPDNSREQFDYDDHYRLIHRTDAESNSQSYGYDERGNLVSHRDADQNDTRFAYTQRGLLATVTAANNSTQSYHYNRHNQPDCITDCSGNQTALAYTRRGQLAQITDALGRQTHYHYDSQHRLIRTDYPDHSFESYHYDHANRLIAHSDSQGNRTEYQYGLDSLPTQRTNALNGTFHYAYDALRRLTKLTNENGAHYRFAYDNRDRLICESAFDGKTSVYGYNAAGELEQETQYGVLDKRYINRIFADAENNLTSNQPDNLSDSLKTVFADLIPLRQTQFQRNLLGALVRITVTDTQTDTVQEKAYCYTKGGKLNRAAGESHITCFDYHRNGQPIAQYVRHINQEQDKQNGLPPTQWNDENQDPLHFHETRNIWYYYTNLNRRSGLELPDNRRLNWLYYGSGHLHHIGLRDKRQNSETEPEHRTIADIERDSLHREIQRTQGQLTSRYELDPVGRLLKQFAFVALDNSKNGIQSNDKTNYAVNRAYQYDTLGNLNQSRDQRSGTTYYTYDPLGRIQSAVNRQTGQNQRFAFDPAHNILSGSLKEVKPVQNNRVEEYNGYQYDYDSFGNLIWRSGNGVSQNYYYDLFDRLIKAEIYTKTAETDGNGKEIWTKQVWRYEYDALDRRVAKWQEVEGSLKQENRIEFLWDGSHLLQEIHADKTYTYVYTDPDSYEPLAQIVDYADKEKPQEINYFHCDQIGIPREMTDKDGNVIWVGDYDAWGQLTEENNYGNAHQPFRLQNQYCDRETGLHYNFFRYYDPVNGRFINQDPIGLFGGENLYFFAPNTMGWVDTFGLEKSFSQKISDGFNNFVRSLQKPTYVGNADPNNCGQQRSAHTAMCRAGLGRVKESGTMGLQLVGGAGNGNGAEGIAFSRNSLGKTTICVYRTLCTSATPDLDGSVGVEAVLSTDELTSGTTTHDCYSASMGLTGTVCSDVQTKSITSSLGANTSVLGANVSRCVQKTQCVRR